MQHSIKPEVLVIGTASVDRLHTADKQVHDTIGGAALYTALAANKAGALVTLFAPRPDPLPERFEELAEQIHWIGPEVAVDEMPKLEIAHYGGGRAELLDASWGAEAKLTPQTLPYDLSNYALIHIAALSSAQRQLDFLHLCRMRAANAISVGTYARVVHNEQETVMKLLEAADLFFMNENEANGLFGSLESIPALGKLLFITRGEQGAVVIENNSVRGVQGNPTTEVDPTGAGDSFCGTVLANLAGGIDPFDAAVEGNRVASKMIQEVGPSGLL